MMAPSAAALSEHGKSDHHEHSANDRIRFRHIDLPALGFVDPTRAA
jgi:hypothetical protein